MLDQKKMAYYKFLIADKNHGMIEFTRPLLAELLDEIERLQEENAALHLLADGYAGVLQEHGKQASS